MVDAAQHVWVFAASGCKTGRLGGVKKLWAVIYLGKTKWGRDPPRKRKRKRKNCDLEPTPKIAKVGIQVIASCIEISSEKWSTGIKPIRNNISKELLNPTVYSTTTRLRMSPQ